MPARLSQHGRLEVRVHRTQRLKECVPAFATVTTLTLPVDKQCILTITKPDSVRRSYATQPHFVKKNEAKLEAARIAVEMGGLEFLAGEAGHVCTRASVETSSTDNAAASDATSVNPRAVHDTFVDDIEKCCLEWRAGHVTPHWVPFSDPKLVYSQSIYRCLQGAPLTQDRARLCTSHPTFPPRRSRVPYRSDL